MRIDRYKQLEQPRSYSEHLNIIYLDSAIGRWILRVSDRDISLRFRYRHWQQVNRMCQIYLLQVSVSESERYISI